MARDVESLVLQMSADLRRFEKSMGQMDAVARKRLTAVEDQALKSQKNLERIMGRAGDGMVGSLKSSLSALAPTIAAAFSAQQVIKYADSYTALQNRLRAAGLEGRELQKVESALYETANRNGLQVQATAELYSRASLSRQRLGASEQQLLQLVSGTASALKVQGTSAEAASGPLLQLGQALSGTKVQAEEYNSLIDGLPVLLQAAAKGSTRFGGDVAKLTEQVKAGKVTSKEFFEALLAGFPAIEAQAGASATTIGSAFQTLDNQLGRYVGQTDASLGATARMAQGIVLLANNLDTIAPIVATLATFLGARYAGSLALAAAQTTIAGVATARLTLFNIGMTASLTGATRAQVALNLAMAANPAGAIITVLAALAAGLFFLASRYNSTAVAARELDRVVGAADTALESYRKAVDAAKGASAAERAELDKKAASLRAVTLARINDAKVAAQRQIDEAVAARQRADAAIGSSADARQRSFANPTNATAALAGGASAQARAAILLAQRQRAEADTAIQAVDRLKAAQDEIENPRAPSVTPPSGGESDSKKGKKDSGPTPEELAAQQKMLDLQGQAEVLKARGRTEEAATVQRQIDVLNLTKQYEDAGFDNAKAKATAQVEALRASERMTQFEQDQARFIEDMADKRRRAADITADELGYRVEIARLLGDEAGIRAAEREEFIYRRINDLLALRPELTRDEAEDRANGEAGKLRGAEIVGGLGDGFKDPLEQMREIYAEVERLRQADVLSEQEAAAAKAQAEALYQEQRLANASSFFGTLAELQNSSNKELAAIGKAAAIVQATMDGYVAVQKALASAPPPFNYIQAAAVGVVAAANVAKIAGMADGGLVRGPGGPREDKVLRRLSAGEFVVNASATSQNRALLEAINSGSVRLPSIPGAGSLSIPTSNNLTYSPTIDARNSDMAAVARLEQIMAAERRQFTSRVMGVVGKKARYRLGQNADA